MLEIKNISKSFQKKKAVDNISFSVKDGTFLGIIGQNGAGKSTTIKIIMGDLIADNGEILFNEKVINIDNYHFRGEIFYIPQKPIFYDYLTAQEYIDWIAEVYRVKDYSQRLDELFKQFEIEDDKNRLLVEFSEGMIKKTVLIAALISNAKIFILDEVFAGLDPVAVYYFKQLLKSSVKDGKTIIFVSHILESVEKLCDSIIMMKNGKIIENLNSERIKEVVRTYSTLEEYYIKSLK